MGGDWAWRLRSTAQCRLNGRDSNAPRANAALACDVQLRAAGDWVMKKSLRKITAAALLGSIALFEMGCAHAHEGPMEKAGRKTDEAASDVKHDVKKAAD